jgi:hypothetical protein
MGVEKNTCQTFRMSLRQVKQMEGRMLWSKTMKPIYMNFCPEACHNVLESLAGAVAAAGLEMSFQTQRRLAAISRGTGVYVVRRERLLDLTAEQ